jgi:antitoxin HicB
MIKHVPHSWRDRCGHDSILAVENRRTVMVSLTRTFTVILEPAEEGGFIVHVPALPEVVTEGDTEEEALAMAKDAIELVLKSRRERGEPIPNEVGKPKVREVTVAIAA